MKPHLRHSIAGWQIALVDFVLVWVSFVLSYLLRYEVEFLRPVEEANFASFESYIPYTLLFNLWTLLLYSSAKLYEHRRDRSLISEVFSLVNGASNATVLLMAVSFLLRPLVFSRLLLLQAALIAVALFVLWRVVIRVVRSRQFARGVGIERVLVIGSGEVARYVIRAIVARPDLGYRLVGFVSEAHQPMERDLGRVPALGQLDDLEQLLNSHEVDLVIITLAWHQQRRILELVHQLGSRQIEVRAVPDLFQLNMAQVKMENLAGVPLLGVRPDLQVQPGLLIVKRALDVAITLALLPFLLPVMLLTALAIRLDSRGSVLYFQERIGLNGKSFNMIKFRSMVQDADQWHAALFHLSEDDPEGIRKPNATDPRITRMGRFIRRTSLDELPQFFNVLRGEMSLVGPRPALKQEVALYKPWHHQRLMVRPGITGLWQVSGRADIPFEEKCLLDIYYIENWSLKLDLQILLQTIPQVLMGRGAY
ncbi:MAG: sugar transferase [Anaerolineae bacterium]|nr:sugar transferase [Anaerolineae bacterium]